MHLVVLVVNDPYHCKNLLAAWRDAGVPGATMIESLGLHRALKRMVRDDVPLFPSLDDIEARDENRNRTIFSVVPDDETIKRISKVTQEIIGSFEDNDTGFMFVVPVSQVFGLRDL